MADDHNKPTKRPRPPKTLDIPATGPQSEDLPFDPDNTPEIHPKLDGAIDDEETAHVAPQVRQTMDLPLVLPQEGPAWVIPGPSQEGDPHENDPRRIVLRTRPKGKLASEITIELYAQLSASLAYRPKDESEILEAEDVVPSEYGRAKRHWNHMMNGAAKNGEEELLIAFDRAYVARLDEERGKPYELADYARFDAAAEMGRDDHVLRQQKVPSAAKMILRRHWLRSIMAEETLLQSYYEEVDKARASG